MYMYVYIHLNCAYVQYMYATCTYCVHVQPLINLLTLSAAIITTSQYSHVVLYSVPWGPHVWAWWWLSPSRLRLLYPEGSWGHPPPLPPYPPAEGQLMPPYQTHSPHYHRSQLDRETRGYQHVHVLRGCAKQWYMYVYMYKTIHVDRWIIIHAPSSSTSSGVASNFSSSCSVGRTPSWSCGVKQLHKHSHTEHVTVQCMQWLLAALITMAGGGNDWSLVTTHNGSHAKALVHEPISEVVTLKH